MPATYITNYKICGLIGSLRLNVTEGGCHATLTLPTRGGASQLVDLSRDIGGRPCYAAILLSEDQPLRTFPLVELLETLLATAANHQPPAPGAPELQPLKRAMIPAALARIPHPHRSAA